MTEMTMGSRTSSEDGLLSLKWNNHRSTFVHILTGLRDKPLHSDVTLACSGELYPVHKLVLSSCSTYFASMFASTHCQHPVIVLKDIHKDELEALLDYMYIGEVDVKQSALEPLIRAAECLHIKGLAAPDEQLPSTRGTTTADRGSCGGVSKRNTSSNSSSNQQEQLNNCAGASSRGSKRPGGSNSGSSSDDGVGQQCTTIVKRRRQDSFESPGVVGATDDSSVTSVSVSYSSLSRGARGRAENLSSVAHSRATGSVDNVTTANLDDVLHTRPQKTPIKNVSHQHYNSCHATDISEHCKIRKQQESRCHQAAVSPVTSEGSAYGDASSTSRLLPSQVIKVELDDDGELGSGGGVADGEEDGLCEDVASGKRLHSYENIETQCATDDRDETYDNLLVSESVVKVEENDVKEGSAEAEDVDNSDIARLSTNEAEQRLEWSGVDEGSEDGPANGTAPKGPWRRGGNGCGSEDTRGGENVPELKIKKGSIQNDGTINATPNRQEEVDVEAQEEKYDALLEETDDVVEGDHRSNYTGDEEEYYEEEDEDISVVRDDASVRVVSNNQVLSRAMLDNLQSLGLAAFPQHSLSHSSAATKLNFSSSLSQLLEASFESSSVPLVPILEPMEEGFRLGSTNYSQDGAFPSNLSTGQWCSGSNRSISIKRGFHANSSNNRPAKLSETPENRPRQEIHPLTGLSLQMSPSSAAPTGPSLHALSSSSRETQRTSSQHTQMTSGAGSLLSPSSSGITNLSCSQSPNIGHLASTARGGNHHHRPRPQQCQVSPSDGGSAPDGPLFCPFCGKLCKRRDHLRVHIRIHTGEKPFQCPYCDRRTNQKNNLKLHIRNVHPGLSANV